MFVIQIVFCLCVCPFTEVNLRFHDVFLRFYAAFQHSSACFLHIAVAYLHNAEGFLLFTDGFVRFNVVFRHISAVFLRGKADRWRAYSSVAAISSIVFLSHLSTLPVFFLAFHSWCLTIEGRRFVAL